jgi:hypothetical protein
MKRLIFLLCLAVVAVPSAFADGVCTDNLGQDVLAPGFYCTLGPLLFSNFQASAGGLPGGVAHLWLGSGIGNEHTEYVNGRANLFFNTNFNQDRYVERDITFAFHVVSTVPVITVDGWLGGYGDRNISENICPTVECLVVLANLDLDWNHVIGNVAIPPSTDFWVVKDISIHGAPGVPASLSEFSQSFEIPEPLTLALVGSGLLGLGLLRRRMRS